MRKQALQADVAIVGLGPTGAVLANLLGQKGWNVIVLERDEDIYYAPRAVHFDDEIMRIFQSIGLADAIARSSESFSRMEFLPRAGAKPLLASNVGTQDRRYGHPGAWWFHQPTLERHLCDGLLRFSNVTVLRGVEATRPGARVLGARETGERVTVTARYVIGCDGGRSLVRKAMGTELESADFDQAWVVVDAKSRSGGKNPALPAVHQQICDPRQPITYVPMAGPYYEWQFMVMNGLSEREATDVAFVRAQLRKLVDLDNFDIIRIAYYRFHALWARDWRRGNVLLAGDSAHQMPPFLGQGMCSGLRDAQSLAWRLNLVLSGRAGETILDDYQRERAEHVRHIIKGAMLLGNVIQTKNRAITVVRNALLFWPSRHFTFFNELFVRAANRKRPIATGFIGKTGALAGTLAIQPMVSHRGQDMLLDEALGGGFALIARAGLPAQHKTLLARLRQNYDIVTVEIGAELVDIEGALGAWLNRARADFALLRPDRYVFDAGTSAQLPAIAATFERSVHAPSQKLKEAA